MVRAKFTVQSHKLTAHTQARTITLSPIYDSSIEEDRRFAKATPSGSIEMYVDNPGAIEQLEIGKVFYVDFTPVE